MKISGLDTGSGGRTIISNVIIVVAALMIAPALFGCGSPAADASKQNICSRGRTFIVVRHAEKEKPPPPPPPSTDDSNPNPNPSPNPNPNAAAKDPSLSALGQWRAKDLAIMLGHIGVTRLIASQFKRTQETLAPLGKELSLNVEVRPAEKTADLIEELRSAPDGSVIVVATHSNVLPQIVRELGGAGAKLEGVSGDALSEDDYARVIVITQPCGAHTPSVMDLRSVAFTAAQ